MRCLREELLICVSFWPDIPPVGDPLQGAGQPHIDAALIGGYTRVVYDAYICTNGSSQAYTQLCALSPYRQYNGVSMCTLGGVCLFIH